MHSQRLAPGVIPAGVPNVAALSQSERTDAARVWAQRAAEERIAGQAMHELATALSGEPLSEGYQWLATRAAQDELQHAELCRGLAQVYAGCDLPCPLIQTGRSRTPDKVLTAFEHICVRESLQGAVFRVAREYATDAAVLRTLSTLVDDENEHAELGWELVATLSNPERVRLSHCASALVASVVQRFAEELAELPLAGVPEHGCPEAELIGAVACDVLAEVVWPGMERAGLDASPSARWVADHGQQLLLGASLGGVVSSRRPRIQPAL